MLKDKRFWCGVLVGYLLVCFVPQLNFRSHMTGGSGGNAG
jgi:hypothetical protein